MTALCGGGASQIKPGIAAVVAVSSAAIAQQLENRGKGWIRQLVPLLVLPPLETQQLCTTDPPGFVDMSAAEVYNAVVSLNLTGDVAAAKAKLVQNIATFAWYALCECASVATPEPPAVTITQPDPMPLPVNDTPVPACQTFTSVQDVLAGANTSTVLPSVYGRNVTWVSVEVSSTTVDANQGSTVTLYGVATNGAELAVQSGTIGPGFGGTDQTFSGPVTVANLDHFRIAVHAAGSTGVTEHLVVTVAAYCGGQLPTDVQQPCLPDPTVAAQLDKLLQLVTLIQRQSVPFAYVPGTRHVGLVGSGQIAVQGLIGISVILTTVPAYLGNIAGDPPELFDVGYVTMGTADGFTRSCRIDHNPTLIFPVSAAVTTIGYTLEPNVVADVLELVREP